MPPPRKKQPASARRTVRKKNEWSEADEKSYQDFLNNSGIKELAMRLRVLEAQGEALGMAPGHRDLLKCPKCGLFENALFNGQLITTRSIDSEEDTGLRFDKLTDGTYLCPGCGARVVEPEYVPPPDLFGPVKRRKRS